MGIISVYDEEPVTYCSKCYSLDIKYEESISSDICMDCGCTETLSTDIYSWEDLYKARYGCKFVTRGTGSIYFNMSIDKLRTILYTRNDYMKVILRLYPLFPKNLGRLDSVQFLFDKLSKDNRFDEFRRILHDVALTDKINKNINKNGNGKEE